MEGTLFKRILVKACREGVDEEKWMPAEELVVTKEANGYALWYSGRDIFPARIIAWSQYGRDDIIAYAVNINLGRARMYADESSVNYKVTSLDDLAYKPLPPVTIPEK